MHPESTYWGLFIAVVAMLCMLAVLLTGTIVVISFILSCIHDYVFYLVARWRNPAAKCPIRRHSVDTAIKMV
jgi:hypothetical protein